MSWQPLDTTQNNQQPPNQQGTEYTSDDENYQTESDSEYDEIEITSWGDTPKEPTWDNLIDPSVKVKADGIGSGDLHRRGGNFKPLSEAAILAQRLNKGIPSKKGSKKPKKKLHASTAPKPPQPGAFFAGRKNRPYVPVARLSATIRAPMKNPVASTWGSVPLADTPFWEKKPEPPKPVVPAAVAAQPSNHLHISQNKSVQPAVKEHNWGSFQKQPQELTLVLHPTPKKAPFLHTENLPAHSILPTETTNPPWNVEAQGFDPSKGKSPVLKPDAVKWNAKVPSFVPSTASTSTSSSGQSTHSSPIAYNTDAPVFVPTFVPPPPIKKILKITSPHATPLPPHDNKSRVHLDQSLLRRHLDIKAATFSSAKENSIEQKEQYQQHQHQQPLQQSQFHAKPTDHQNQLESQTQPESTRGFEEEPFLRINLEISEGISTTISVQEGSNPDELAEEFGVRHRLKMTSKAKKNMASFISNLIEKKKNEKKFGLID